MKKEIVLSLLSKYAESHEYFIIKYTTGKRCLAQFNLFGILCWHTNNGVYVPGVLVLDYVEEVIAVDKEKTHFSDLVAAGCVKDVLTNKRKMLLRISNASKRFAIWIERLAFRGSK